MLCSCEAVKQVYGVMPEERIPHLRLRKLRMINLQDTVSVIFVVTEATNYGTESHVIR